VYFQKKAVYTLRSDVRIVCDDLYVLMMYDSARAVVYTHHFLEYTHKNTHT